MVCRAVLLGVGRIVLLGKVAECRVICEGFVPTDWNRRQRAQAHGRYSDSYSILTRRILHEGRPGGPGGGGDDLPGWTCEEVVFDVALQQKEEYV